MAWSLHGHSTDVLLAGDELQIVAWGRYGRNDSVTFLPLFESSQGSTGTWGAEVNAKYTTPVFYLNRLSIGIQARAISTTMDTSLVSANPCN